MSVESLTTDLNHQLERAVRLRNLCYDLILAEQKIKMSRAQKLAAIIFYRSLQTHEAVEHLMRQHLVEDARVLVRVVVEHAVNCAYMLLVANDDAANDFIMYPRYHKYELLVDLKSVDENRFRKSVPRELEEEIRRDHESLLPRFKGRRNAEWCFDGPLYKRASKVDERISQEFNEPYIEFRWLVNSEWRFASSHVHGTAESLIDQVTRVEGVTTIEQRFDPVDAAEGLYSANFGLGLATRFIDMLFGAKKSNELMIWSKKFNGRES